MHFSHDSTTVSEEGLDTLNEVVSRLPDKALKTEAAFAIGIAEPALIAAFFPHMASKTER